MSKRLKVAFCGIGSIGSKHMLNLAQVLRRRGYSFRFDVVRSGKGRELSPELDKLITSQFGTNEDIDEDYDIVFITNPTNQHYETISRYVNKTKNMFIEKPVFDSFDIDVEKLYLRPDGIYYVACPLRYSEVFQHIKQEIDYKNAYAVRAICSSYLPEWRKNVDYRESYSARKSMGGGVRIDLIHEWDYLMNLFGKPDEVHVISGTYSSLEIDSEDCAIYIARQTERTIELHLDYYGRKPIREIQFFFQDKTIVADFLAREIKTMSRTCTLIEKKETYDWYIKELETFLDMIEGKIANENTIFAAVETMKVAGGII